MASKGAKDDHYPSAKGGFEDERKVDDEEEELYQAESKNAEREKIDYSKEDKSLHENEIIEKLQAYFFEDESLSSSFENFIDDNSHIVNLNAEEYKLEYTAVFEKYKILFETKMEDFITKELKVSINTVYRALKSKMDSDENSMESFFAQVLIAVTDFDTFMVMMRESAKKLHARASHK
jgi:hypothetical protein